MNRFRAFSDDERRGRGYWQRHRAGGAAHKRLCVGRRLQHRRLAQHPAATLLSRAPGVNIDVAATGRRRWSRRASPACRPSLRVCPLSPDGQPRASGSHPSLLPARQPRRPSQLPALQHALGQVKLHAFQFRRNHVWCFVSNPRDAIRTTSRAGSELNYEYRITRELIISRTPLFRALKNRGRRRRRR